jgi:WXG100 family type VII secretion target
VLGVSLEALIDTAVRVGSIAEQFNERLQSTSRRVNGFLDGGWTGDPGNAYADAFTEWSDGAGEVQSGLAEMAAALAENATVYAARDAAGAAALSSTTAGMPLGEALFGPDRDSR